MRKLAYGAFGSAATAALLLGGAAAASAHAHGASAEAATVNSPGVGSGNSIQVPVDIPVNLCGNTVDVIGVLNPAFGNSCANVY
ncbi:chaplin [Kitasatospora sp. NPDC002227]|uniref:chaplin n=1 Tax=Kitasatospora sp. NPDC002227 TaxID=3154773 RepID=UPI00331F0775